MGVDGVPRCDHPAADGTDVSMANSQLVWFGDVPDRPVASHDCDHASLECGLSMAEHQHVRGRDDIHVVRVLFCGFDGNPAATHSDAYIVCAFSFAGGYVRLDGGELHASASVTSYFKQDAGVARCVAVYPYQRDHLFLRTDLPGFSLRNPVPAASRVAPNPWW